jgi:hypothetical protein
VAFVGIESRSPAPLLPLRIFRLRTLSAANATILILGATTFGQFLLITLYPQEVLRYSAIETGVAFVAVTLMIVAGSNVSQPLTTRLGARPVLTAGPRAHARVPGRLLRADRPHARGGCDRRRVRRVEAEGRSESGAAEAPELALEKAA